MRHALALTVVLVGISSAWGQADKTNVPNSNLNVQPEEYIPGENPATKRTLRRVVFDVRDAERESSEKASKLPQKRKKSGYKTYIQNRMSIVSKRYGLTVSELLFVESLATSMKWSDIEKPSADPTEEELVVIRKTVKDEQAQFLLEQSVFNKELKEREAERDANRPTRAGQTISLRGVNSAIQASILNPPDPIQINTCDFVSSSGKPCMRKVPGNKRCLNHRRPKGE